MYEKEGYTSEIRAEMEAGQEESMRQEKNGKEQEIKRLISKVGKIKHVFLEGRTLSVKPELTCWKCTQEGRAEENRRYHPGKLDDEQS
ncbi:hypothetical protein AVEN_171464-1 [Araneus ventricosus]|uniref:Uncharacterized protein n=1 Tax=Araneus ventricosus TaxID=182803 RepID=A0A4Y2HZE8_ARAVE|nr:hypothetical protein AVEN_171464-1 [Araneus ventricosus]